MNYAERMNIFLSADPGGIGSAFHRAEEGRKKKSHVLKSLQHYIIMDINKLSGKIIGAAIEACPPLQAQARRAGT